jgi:predicted GNAT family acetyltransferase
VQYLKSKLPSGDLYLWVDNDAQKIRSIVATAGKTDAVIRIALVFTSKKFRGNGYASAAVATVTNANLRSGLESVTLTVESGDFESIRMYKSLGYVYLSECIELISQE